VIRREISMMAQSACCPQMTRYLGSQVVGSHLQIIMEYMGGGALSDLVRASSVSRFLFDQMDCTMFHSSLWLYI
jgi:serine/threonine protein kinase